jgi:hypothetical protein
MRTAEHSDFDDLMALDERGKPLIHVKAILRE